MQLLLRKFKMEEYVKLNIEKGIGIIEFFHPQSNALPANIKKTTRGAFNIINLILMNLREEKSHEAIKICLNLFPPKYLVTVSTVSRTDNIPENKNPNNKKGLISSNKDHIFSNKYICLI